MATGWTCPKCGRVYSPLESECTWCNGLLAIPAIQGIRPTQAPLLTPHPYQPPYTTGDPPPDQRPITTC